MGLLMRRIVIWPELTSELGKKLPHRIYRSDFVFRPDVILTPVDRCSLLGT
jgi:hypothetical protein